MHASMYTCVYDAKFLHHLSKTLFLPEALLYAYIYIHICVHTCLYVCMHVCIILDPRTNLKSSPSFPQAL